MTNRQYAIYALFLVSLLVLCAAFWYIAFREAEPTKEKKIAEPLDVVLDYYTTWLEATKAAGRPTSESDLVKSPVLTPAFATSLALRLKDTTAPDPVLCQVEVPDKVAAKIVHELPAEAVVMLYSRFASSTPTGYALVTMTLEERTWRINEVVCTAGDVDVEREFTFETDGQLLKNVPAPLDNTKWHLVFTENGTPGHAAPLRFTASSTCIAPDGVSSVCDQATFTEASYAKVVGNMTEEGVDVVTLTLVSSTQ